MCRQGIYKLLGSDTGRESMREEGNMTYWLVCSGTDDEPHIHDDWRQRERPWVETYGDVWSFRQRPRRTTSVSAPCRCADTATSA